LTLCFGILIDDLKFDVVILVTFLNRVPGVALKTICGFRVDDMKQLYSTGRFLEVD